MAHVQRLIKGTAYTTYMSRVIYSMCVVETMLEFTLVSFHIFRKGHLCNRERGSLNVAICEATCSTQKLGN